MSALMRTCILLLALVLTGCESRDGYFGRVKTPTEPRLVIENRMEPSTLDPQMMLSTNEGFIADALFGALVRSHPITLEPTADIATHYERNPEATRYVFYLRGNPHARGTRLPNTDDIREEFRTGQIKEDLARGHSAPPDSVPARWSDGKPVTAHDFVYSWRRLFDPKTAAPYAHFSTYFLNSAEILAGKLPPRDLGVRALDDWTLEVLLARPNDFFLRLLDVFTFFAVPRQAIEAAEARGAPASWAKPEHIVTNGPFLLAEWRPYEDVVLRRNPGYWEAGLTGLDEIVFLPITDNLVNLNLYRSGDADTLELPPAYIPALQNMRDHVVTPLLNTYYISCNTRSPPLDNVLVRYALNMATDKREVAKLFYGDHKPALTLGIPALGYQPPASAPLTIQGQTYDVSAYNPAAARELLAVAGFDGGLRKDGQRLRLDYIYAPGYPVGENLAETLRRQWLDNLGIELAVRKLDSAEVAGAIASGSFRGMAQTDWVMIPEPSTFFDLFWASEQANGTFWRPDAFTSLMNEAKGTVDRTARLMKVAEGDRMILEGMPVIPLIYNSRHDMVKPYVKGLPFNQGLILPFLYAWVETQ